MKVLKLASKFIGLVFFLLMGSVGLVLSHAQAQSNPTTWELRVCADQNDLPYSNEQEQGFENRIISLLTQDLHAKLTYLWLQLPKLHGSIQPLRSLRQDKCDLVLEVGDGEAPYLTTLAYYQSTYVFAYRADASFDTKSLSFDDPVLRNLSIGVLSSSVPDVALLSRGFRTKGNLHYEAPTLSSPTPLLDDVAQGKIDMAIVWGPVAGYYAKTHDVKLKIVPVTPQVGTSGISMVYSFSFGLRHGDTELRDLLDKAIADKWDGIQKVLKDYNIPVVPLPKPVLSIGG
jgi:quinoprotein dehydrogenase-associated probable ABC transporter substrate-binding protein